MQLHGQNLIGGQLSRDGANPFSATSPLDQRVLAGHFHPATTREIDAALTLAEHALGPFARTTGEQRACFLETIAGEIFALGDTLLQRAHEETGLPPGRLTGERARTIGQLKLFAQVAREGSWVDARIDPAQPARQPQPRPDLRRMLVPLGPVVVFGASNFPLAFSVAGGDTASALATGNPVVVKAHERHPGTSELVATAICCAVEKCGLPAGVFSLLHGADPAVGTALVRHPLTRAVGFTGSRLAGRALCDAAAMRPDPIPVFAEMSSINPVFLLPHALAARSDAIAEGLKVSFTLGVGQFCTKPGLVIGVDSEAFSALRDRFASRVAESPPGTLLHEGICRAFERGLARLSPIEGVQPLARSAVAIDRAQTHAAPVAFQTTAGRFLAEPLLAEEIFGPLTIFVIAQSSDEMLAVARALEGQLTATLHGTAEDLASAAELIHILERKAGRLLVNGFPTGVEVSPAMNHGGPYPATTDSRFTSVGTAALERFVRPVCYQDFPADQLPPALRNENPLSLWRLIDGRRTQAPIV